jgi:hypothetical protein
MVLDEQFEIEGFPASAHLQLLRSKIQLSTRGEEGDYADAGLLVISQGTIISLTMLKFENDPYASFFYGSIQCDYLHDLLKNDEPVLTATRDGINWSLPFAKALKQAVESRIEPLVQTEREHAMHDEQMRLDKRLRRKLDKTIREMNTIASSELSDGRDHSSDGKGIEPPPAGLGFVSERVFVQTGRTVTLTLRAKLHENARGRHHICRFRQPRDRCVDTEGSDQSLERSPAYRAGKGHRGGKTGWERGRGNSLSK